MILFQSVEDFGEGPGSVFNRLGFFRRKIIEVLFERLARLSFILNSVQTCHQLGGKTQVGISGRIRAAELDPLGFRALRINGNSNRSRPIPLRIRKIYGGLIARNQSSIGIGRGRAETQQRRSVLQQAADVILSRFAQHGIALFVIKQIRVALP